jgi:hypothetical protein
MKRQCKRCRLGKPLAAFRKGRETGLRSICGDCRRDLDTVRGVKGADFVQRTCWRDTAIHAEAKKTMPSCSWWLDPDFYGRAKEENRTRLRFVNVTAKSITALDHV